MYLGSDEFNNAIENTQGNAPKIRVTLEDGTTLDNIKSIKFYGGSNDSDDISIGTTNMARIDVTAFTDKMLTNNEIFLEQGVELANGVVEYMPIGYFTVQKPSGDIDEVSFTAYDRMQKFEKPYSSSLAYPTTSALILNELCQICGIELAATLDNAIEVTENLKGYTCREVLGYIASMYGYFACIDRYGRLNVRWYSNIPIEKSLKKIWHFEKSQDNFEIARVEIAKDSETNYVSGSGITTLYNSNPLATQEITDDVFAKLGRFSYSVGEIEMLDDARLDPWDMISVEYYDGKTYIIPCMALEHDFKAYSTTVKSVGKSESENEYRFTGPTIQYLNRMAADLLVANRVIATKVDAEYVNSVAITTENLEAKVAEIKELVVEEIDGKYATIDFANIDVANINKTNIGLLFAEVGLLDRATIVDGHVTGFLDAVEINANKITAGTLIADRLLLRGSEQSILYQLNSLSRNLIPYPYAETTHIDNGITWTDLGNGKIKASGKATADSFFLLSPFTVPAGTYTISGSVPIENTTIQLITNGSYAMSSNWLNLTKTITYNEETYFNYCRILIKAGVTVEDVIFEPMLVSGSEVLPFEPFRERTQGLTSETINGEVLTDRTITADKIIAKSITTNELDVDKIFGNEAVLNKIVSQEIFSDAVATNRVVVGKADSDEIIAENLLPYPYKNTTSTINGITFTDNGDGTITMNGTATADSIFLLSPVSLKAGTYTLSVSDSGFNSNYCNFQMSNSATSTWWGIKAETSSSGVRTYTLAEDLLFDYNRLLVKKGHTMNNVTWKPMVEVGEVAHTYREYAKSGTGIANNLYREGTTLIDGNKIYTGSILADSIDIDDLFADTAFIDALRTNSIIVGIGNKADTALSEVNKTVKSITMHYLATTASSGVTTSTSGWTTTVQQINATKKYLWTYQTITYVDNTTTNTSPVISGVYGNEGKDGTNGTNGTNGVGVSSVIPLYYLKSNTTAPSAPTSAVTSTSTGSGVWTKTVPTYVNNYTYFTCTQTQYTDGTYKWSTVVADNSLTDAYASLENKANIDEVVAVNLLPYPYYESTHTENVITWTVNTDGTIGVSSGTPTADCYFVFRHHATADKIHLVIPAGTYTLSGGTSKIPLSAWKIENGATTTQLALDNGKGATFTVNTDTRLNVRLHITKNTVVEATTIKPMLEVGSVAHHYTEYSKGGVGITNNIYQAGTTLIDGAKIYTGSITADKIDVDDLFAQDITATGTITGATLIGANAQIENGSIGQWQISDGKLIANIEQKLINEFHILKYKATEYEYNGDDIALRKQRTVSINNKGLKVEYVESANDEETTELYPGATSEVFHNEYTEYTENGIVAYRTALTDDGAPYSVVSRINFGVKDNLSNMIIDTSELTIRSVSSPVEISGGLNVSSNFTANKITTKSGADLDTINSNLDGAEIKTWTPVAGGNLKINSIEYAYYVKIGKVVFIMAQLNMQSLGGTSQNIIKGVPYKALKTQYLPVGWSKLPCNYNSFKLQINSAGYIMPVYWHDGKTFNGDACWTSTEPGDFMFSGCYVIA